MIIVKLKYIAKQSHLFNFNFNFETLKIVIRLRITSNVLMILNWSKWFLSFMNILLRKYDMFRDIHFGKQGKINYCHMGSWILRPTVKDLKYSTHKNNIFTEKCVKFIIKAASHLMSVNELIYYKSLLLDNCWVQIPSKMGLSCSLKWDLYWIHSILKNNLHSFLCHTSLKM